MFCVNCGAELPENTNFCTKCGAPQRPSSYGPISMPGHGRWEQKKGFFASLFDFSFSDFITTKITKVLYVTFVVLWGLISIAVIILTFVEEPKYGIAALIAAPLVFLLGVIFTRLYLEAIIIIFRIAEFTKDIRDIAKQRQKQS